MLTLGHYLLAAAGANTHLADHVRAVAHPHHAVAHHRPRHPSYIHLPILSHLRVHGPAIDYLGLFLLSVLSGLGINGFGEAALIAAAVYVANHHLPLAPVILIAAAGGFLGGVAGFVIGRHGGRTILTAPGPIARLRRRMLAHSEEVYLRYDTLAILITPAWAAGIHRARWPRFLPLNLASALLWAGILGLGAYFLGSRITTEFDDEIGWVIAGVVGVLVLYQLIGRALRSPSRGR